MARPSPFARVLYRLTGWLRCRVIRGNRGEPYLERYHLLRLPGGGGVYIHRFLDSDPDRGLHDHPWPWSLGLVLASGYLEQRLERHQGVLQITERKLRPGRVNFIRDRDFHRIVLPERTEAWTLFVHGRKTRDWGFLQLDAAGRQRFEPHEAVVSEQAHQRWWRNAPRGRCAGRMPLPTA